MSVKGLEILEDGTPWLRLTAPGGSYVEIRLNADHLDRPAGPELAALSARHDLRIVQFVDGIYAECIDSANGEAWYCPLVRGKEFIQDVVVRWFRDAVA